MVANKEKDAKKLEEQNAAFLAVGFVPRKNMSAIQDRFAKAVEAFVANLEGTALEKEKMKFGFQMKIYGDSPEASRKFRDREQGLRKRISHLEDDIALWKNNLEFFAKSKTADRLRTEFGAKIADASKELNALKAELKGVLEMNKQ
jgi:hypothetical protein